MERFGAGRRIQVRDADGHRLLDLEIADGTVTVRTHLRRDRAQAGLLAQRLLPDLMTGWPDPGLTRAFTTVISRMSGTGRPPTVRLMGAEGVLTMELSGTRGSRQLDVTVVSDHGNLTLYFDEGDDDSPGGSDPGGLPPSSERALPTDVSETGVSDTLGPDNHCVVRAIKAALAAGLTGARPPEVVGLAGIPLEDDETDGPGVEHFLGSGRKLVEIPVDPRAGDPHEAIIAELKALGVGACLLYTSPSPRDGLLSRMPSSA